MKEKIPHIPQLNVFRILVGKSTRLIRYSLKDD